MTWLEFAKAEAQKLGVYLTDEIADYILWEKTAFPCMGKDHVGQQIQDHLNEKLYEWQTAYPPPESTGPTRFERITDGDT